MNSAAHGGLCCWRSVTELRRSLKSREASEDSAGPRRVLLRGERGEVAPLLKIGD
jgi:hypothetical protein